MSIQQNKEEDFNEWLESIVFVDAKGNLVPATLTDDESTDPEGDREGE